MNELQLEIDRLEAELQYELNFEQLMTLIAFIDSRRAQYLETIYGVQTWKGAYVTVPLTGWSENDSK